MATEPLVVVPMPPLVMQLQLLEQKKGSPLTEAEVRKAAGDAPSIMLPLSEAQALIAKRGYRDIDLDNAWAGWQASLAAR